MKKYVNILILFMIVILPIRQATAQAEKAKRGQDVTFTVVDESGSPVKGATVWANKGGKQAITGVDGTVALQSVQTGEVLVEAEGFEGVTLDYAIGATQTVTLYKAGAFLGEKDGVHLPYAVLPQRRVVGAISVIKGADLETSTEINVKSALAGRAAGLFVFKGSGVPGDDYTSLHVRGRSRAGSSSPLIVVDGVPFRDLAVLNQLEIESIEVLKDATSKIMYGAGAANGVLNITTKRGVANKRIAKVSVEYGIKTPTVLPKYLNSADYARLYNQARHNDGLEDFYPQSSIDGYVKGTDPVLYPDVDFQSALLKSSTNYRNVNAQFLGGSANTRYFLSLGYVGMGGLESVGEETTYDRLNLNGKLDYDVNEIISTFINVNVYTELRHSSNMGPSDFFTGLSTHRPNEYPLYFTYHPNPDSIMLGWSSTAETNLYGELTMTGFTDTTRISSQTDIGLKFNLQGIAKGLSAKAGLSFDTYNTLADGKTETYPRYKTDLTKVGDRVLSADKDRKADNFFMDYMLNASVDYARDFQKSAVTSNLVFTAQERVRQGQDLNYKNTNLAYRLNYAYDNKYILEANAALMGSGMFDKANRYGLFPAAGAAWVLSEEGFMSDVGFVDFLKLKGSFGIVGYDGSMDFLWWKDAYRRDGSVVFGINNSTSRQAWAQVRAGNPGLTFEKSRELNVGAEGLLFNNTLFFEVNLFDELRYDIPVQAAVLYPDYLGGTVPYVNYEEVSNKGIEVSATLSRHIGDFRYAIGGNITSTYSENVTVSELNPYPWLNQQGTATDAIWGFMSEGFYANEAEIQAHNVISNYGALKPGDLKFTDLNNDQLIDTQDRQVLGNSFPRLNYALNLMLAYKGLEFSALGQGISGLDNLRNNLYYRNFGERKYSVEALGAWTQTTAATATYPRLTTSADAHSMENSSFWLVNGAYFKLRNVELSYALPRTLTNKFFVKNMKVFARGTDLLTISKVKTSDPESFSAGVTNYPMFRTVTGGIKLGF